MDQRSCFLIGHRDTGSHIYPLLQAEVERHIVELGVTEFYVGHYGAFDSMAARAVIEAKKRHPAVRLTMVLPYHPALRPAVLPAGFDCSYFPEELVCVPPGKAILRANAHMVRSCDFLICYVCWPSNGARAALDLALRLQKHGLIRVTNLADTGEA